MLHLGKTSNGSEIEIFKNETSNVGKEQPKDTKIFSTNTLSDFTPQRGVGLRASQCKFGLACEAMSL
eukprot:5936671-Amphidinium_carterae.1